MTAPLPPGGREELALHVAHALPFDGLYRYPRHSAALAITTAYQGGGLTSAAERAYLAGYRAGERDGQLAASRAAYEMFDQRWFWEPEGAKRTWLADCMRHADDWAFEASQRFYSSRNPEVDLSAARRALPQVGPKSPPDEALPQVAATAYRLGAEAGRSDADRVTIAGIAEFVHERAAELGLDPALVDAELDQTPVHRPRTPARSDGLPPAPSAVARLSFAEPATPAPTPPLPPPGTAAGRAPHRKGKHR